MAPGDLSVVTRPNGNETGMSFRISRSSSRLLSLVPIWRACKINSKERKMLKVQNRKGKLSALTFNSQLLTFNFSRRSSFAC